MQDIEVINILQDQFNFSSKTISALKIFKKELLKANTKHNFISRSTESNIWHRHILDSAQLVKFIDFSDGSLSDWIREKSFQSNEGCDVLPKPENRSNSPYFSVVLPDQEALNPENIVIAAEEKSSATIYDFPKINQICSQAA